MKALPVSFVAAGLLAATAVSAEPDYRSEYVGQETRAIKTLSAEDVDELRRGAGWGFAKAAELNGVPGPLHVLQMDAEIGLTGEQRKAVQALHESMKASAVPLGKELVALEARLNERFADGTIDRAGLEELLVEIGRVRSQLRMVHLEKHLETADVLTDRQVAKYNRLRGYGSDPCESVPAGHDPEMWRRHNGC
ncbi:periplasmic heavy metal sensor [Ectothiorhodospiraceae bacterium WFHF3C12]|nr:periplasmic heavy metal sensor [Ectothiorhodospiraceae bacterium WFHF3C12]